MSDDYYFFLSYARANHDNAVWERQGVHGNHLDEFFELLCREVSDRTGRPADKVAYRDQNRLKMSDFWDQALVEGLQRSRVLLSLISPHYLQSENCGRELEFFDRRLEGYLAQGGSQQAHRILPLFWQNSETSLKNLPSGIRKFLNRCNLTQSGMPTSYPAVGLSQLIKLRPGTDYEQLCQSLADRIVDLADNLDPLPKLAEQGDFSELNSLYARLAENGEEDLVLNGPDGVNVVYLVGTRAEMESVGVEAERYAEDPQEWWPFPHALGANIRILTEEGANSIGLTSHRHFNFPDNLVRLIDAASQRNSPVLLVLDRCILSVPGVAEKMESYSRENFDNCGLVTAGGSEISDDLVQEVFKFKCIRNYPYHIWNVPTDRSAYVSSVASVLGGIKHHFINYAETFKPLAGTTLPGLSGPTED
jgi:hypothetical protein